MFKIKKLYIVLILFLTFGCTIAPPTPFYQPAFNLPDYLYNSGILELKQTLAMPFGDGADVMSFSNDGRYLATSGDKSRHINFWDLQSGKNIYSFTRLGKDRRGREKILYGEDVYFTSDNKTVFLNKYPPVLSAKKTYKDRVLFNLEDGTAREIQISRTILTGNLRFSPDGKYVASYGGTATKGSRNYGNGKIIQLMNADDWTLVSSVDKGFGAAAIRFTPDGKYIIDHERVGDESAKHRAIDGAWRADYKGRKDKYLYPEIRIWSVPDLRLVRSIDNVFKSLADEYIDISPDGRYVAVTGRNDSYSSRKSQVYVLVRIFDIESGELVHELPRVHGDLYFSHDSRYLIVGSGQAHMAIRIYDTKEWKLQEQVKLGKTYWSIETAMSGDGSRLAMSNGSIVYVWDIKN